MRYDRALFHFVIFFFVLLSFMCPYTLAAVCFLSAGAVPPHQSILPRLRVRLGEGNEQHQQVQPIHPEVKSSHPPETAACRGGTDGGDRRVASGGVCHSPVFVHVNTCGMGGEGGGEWCCTRILELFVVRKCVCACVGVCSCQKCESCLKR